jgi:hypothetical protein
MITSDMAIVGMYDNIVGTSRLLLMRRSTLQFINTYIIHTSMARLSAEAKKGLSVKATLMMKYVTVTAVQPQKSEKIIRCLCISSHLRNTPLWCTKSASKRPTMNAMSPETMINCRSEFHFSWNSQP